MFFTAQYFRRQIWTGVLIATTLLGWSGGANAADPNAPGFNVVDSKAWQAHFESWVETNLVDAEIRQAADSLPEFEPKAILRILGKLETQHLRGWRGESRLPHDVQPRMLARGIKGILLRAAKLYAKGKNGEALALLGDPNIAGDAKTIHLRVQILDQLTRELQPIFRLGIIDLYREAIRSQATGPLADRAKVRIGQIYLELGFMAEAQAQFRSLREPPLSEPFATQARVSLAEVSYLYGDPKAALRVLAQLDPNQLSPEVQNWHSLRIADALFTVGDDAGALKAYARLDGHEHAGALAAIRHGFALTALGDPEKAHEVIAESLGEDVEPRLQALGGLVLARVLREAGKLEKSMQAASAVSSASPDPDTAALAAIESMEVQRLMGRTSLALPKDSGSLVSLAPDSPAVALLSYRVAAAPNPGDRTGDAEQRLGSLLATLPGNEIQLLAQDDLTRRLVDRLASAVQKGNDPDPELLDSVERFFRPRIINENALLLAVDALAGAERRGSCVRWARTLALRELRPIRKGLAAWREVRCLAQRNDDRGASHRLMQLADSGTAGPFALALATLAAENQVRLGDLDRAVRSYERALQVFAEPVLLPPVLLRLGELEVATHRLKLAQLRLTRGLSLTSGKSLAGDPFRKAALLAVTELAAQTGDRTRLAQTLKSERKLVGPWWSDAYAYALFRNGEPQRPSGETPFTQVAEKLTQMNRAKSRVDRVIRNHEEARRAAAAARSLQ